MSDTLFSHAAKRSAELTPLAERMRPQDLDEVVGQAHLLGEGQFLSEMTRLKRLPSIILWGPPGTGKTTLAKLLAEACGAALISLSAVWAGVKDLKAALEKAEADRAYGHKQSVLFVDEIHRFNKAQQDALLHHVEQGSVVLIGATTENPSFEVNAALLSRCRVVVLKALDEAALETLLARALTDAGRGLGLGRAPSDGEREALHVIATLAQGDARRALSTLEIAFALAGAEHQTLSVEAVKLATQRTAIRYDHAGDEHYQIISAFIKSLRGSDVDASLYWLARMLAGGEDPLFVCRRLAIFASEDIGNADPGALAVAMHVTEAVKFVGLPEAQLGLAQCVTYLALAPKSNRSMLALSAARAAVEAHGPLPVPPHLVNAETKLMKEMGFGEGYDYPHDHPDAIGRQTYLPDALLGSEFYTPSDRGREADLKRRLDALRQFRKELNDDRND